ncbi:uncharacterized protein LOC124540412 [Vanessa cardui]|uniref:uncharacterized protein LOC124540412 n=1 Tax=Vanessa cardui TaxID=171605 RepID=UPI001F136BB9|nr:uncharacterized protein LOC124540412 [Vanessa cardui]
MSTKKSIKWSDNIMSRFLELYQQYECLWNNNTEVYKNRDARESAIQKIINELNLKMTEADIKNKIKSIRTMYRRELLLIIKSKKSGAAPDDVYRPRLNWFNQADSFLRAVTVARESISSSDINDFAGGDIESTIEDPLLTSESIETSEFVRPSSSQSQPPQVIPATFRKRKKDTVNESINKLHKISSPKKQELDEFDYFGKFVTAQLRKMPEYDAILCQEEMHSIMRKYRLRLLSGSLNSSPSMSPSDHSVSTNPSPPPPQIHIKNEIE